MSAKKLPARKLKNFVVQPKFQLSHGFYFLFCVGFTTLLVQWLIFDALRNAIANYHAKRNLAEIAEWIEPSLTALGPQHLIALVILAAGAGVFGIVVSHRVAGPSVAIKRLIADLKKGHYGNQITLRTKDELQDIADDLNALSLLLEQRHELPSENILALSEYQRENQSKKKSA